ncbi:olfactory receptor 6B1-like [Spea bombifrons]|uniref:olfactory receptor 6B1-like n=1 Tax=Spea bombifrons TaxID=233779 RepID=UPI00234BF4A4|nr:olfactory receptor 6B1-like [Spea bombifrons]
MYFFLCHLSFSDLLFTVDIIPNMLYVIWKNGGSISFTACLTQFHIFGESTCTECLLLAVMSYDRYLAICRPLHYASIMNVRLQYKLVAWTWVLGFIMTLCVMIQMYNLQFCGSNIIDHYFCDFGPLLDHSCSDISLVRMQVNVFSCLLVVPPFFLIVGTYFYIFLTILKMSSTKGREKAFFTCSSHLAVVCAYYGSLSAVYLSSSKSRWFNANKFLSLLNTVGTPLFNPIIYSFRNVDIRAAIWKVFFAQKQKDVSTKEP